MAFIVKKTINGNEYYYLNENKRIQGKVKTKTLAYLGKTEKQAQEKAKKFLANLNKKDLIEDKITKNKMEESFATKQENSEHSKKLDKQLTIEELANFCKVKGFVFRSSDIYGGITGFWDFGP